MASKRLGAALFVLVRALLSSYRSYGWCLSIRPMTPEMWLDLSPSHTVLAHFAADRQTSSEVQRGVALQSFGLASFVCHPASCGLCATGWRVGAQFFLSRRPGVLCGGRVCRVLMRPTSHGVETAGGSTFCAG